MLQRMSNDQNDNTLLFYNNNQGFQLQNRTNNMKHVFPQKRGNVVAVEPYNHNPTKMSQNQELMNIRNEMSNKMNVDTDESTFVLKKTPYGVSSFMAAGQMDRKETSDSKIELKKDNYHGRSGLASEPSKTNDKLNKVVQLQGGRINNNDEMQLNNIEDLEFAKRNKDEQNSTFPSSFKPSNVFDHDESKKSQENNNSEHSASEISMKFKHRNTHIIPSGNLLTPPRKPISSVAPSSFTNSTLFTGNSPKVHVVSPSVSLISQLSNMEKPRPALPPKPSKGNVPANADDCKPESIESVSIFSSVQTDTNPIKAKPLTIKKQPVTEQPKLKSTIVKHPQTTFQQFDVQKQPQMSGDMKFMFDNNSASESNDEPDKIITESIQDSTEKPEGFRRKRALANENMKIKLARRVSFDPLGN